MVMCESWRGGGGHSLPPPNRDCSQSPCRKTTGKRGLIDRSAPPPEATEADCCRLKRAQGAPVDNRLEDATRPTAGEVRGG